MPPCIIKNNPIYLVCSDNSVPKNQHRINQQFSQKDPILKSSLNLKFIAKFICLTVVIPLIGGGESGRTGCIEGEVFPT